MTQQIDCVELYSVPAFFSVKVEMNTRACVESYEGYLELVSKELNHLVAILHVYAGELNFMK